MAKRYTLGGGENLEALLRIPAKEKRGVLEADRRARQQTFREA